jgi:Zn-dependent M28 family amino/carboxypeptidase
MKFKILLAGAAAFSLAVAAPAQSPAPDFSADSFRAHVTHLADDSLGGREAGTPGYDLGARYVAEQFQALGLRPAMADGAWLQPVGFLRYRISGTPRLRVGRRDYRLSDTVSFRPTPEASVRLEAPAVFAGFGLDAPEYGANDFDGLDVRGKIVVVFAGLSRDATRDIPSDVAAHLFQTRRAMAARRGAIGVIEISTRPVTPRSSTAAAQAAAARPGATWAQANGEGYSDAPGLRFHATVDVATAQAMFPVASDRLTGALRAATAGASPRGFDLGQTVTVAQDNTVERFTSPNVLAVIPGTDPALASEYVLLMAHLDGLGTRAPRDGDAPDEDRIRNGAMDNATGVATLIEVARAMTREGNRSRRPVLLAAVTAEEIGLLGASYLARNLPVEGRVISVVNLDMPILTYDFQDVTAFGAEHSTMGPIVARAAERMGVAVSPDPLPEQSLFVRSDHYRFVQAGVPSVFLMTGFANGGRERFQGFLGTEYHSPRDDLSLPFNWQAGARFAQLNYLIAREIADGPEAPLWYADSYFGKTLGGDQPRAERPAG